MPFNPTIPQENTPIDAAPMREQFNSLKALIDAIVTVTAAQVDGVSTLPAGSAATVTASVTGSTLHFTFEIPQGAEGPAGAPGTPGEVSLSQLNNAISGTSSNSNGVNLLALSADGSYNQSQMQDLINKVDELIGALRR